MKGALDLLSGRHCVVTGASGGIGEAIASELASRGASVTLVARPGERLLRARARLQERFPEVLIQARAVDLSRQAEVRELAGELAAKPIHALILNAAIVSDERRETCEGIEETLAVNHLAPFLLTQLLLPTLHRAEEGRVVLLGADPGLLSFEPVDLEDLAFRRGFSPMKAYMRSKNMNAMFCYALARRLAGTGLTVNVAHPGVIRSNLARRVPGVTGAFFALLSRLLPGPERGADTPAWLVWSSAVAGVSGKCFVKRREKLTARHTLDVERQERLWKLSAQLTGLAL